MSSDLPSPERRGWPEAVSGEFAGTIRLGAALSETGKYAMEGEDSRQGYDTWLRWVNGIGGGIRVGGERYRAEIVYYYDESDADTAGNLTQQLIDEDRVDLLLGPYSSGLTTGTSAIAEANNVLMVEGNGTSDTMFERGFENLFLVATIASNHTRSGIEALAARAPRRRSSPTRTSFVTAVAAGAARHLEAHGIDVLATETYPKDIQDVSAIMTKFRDLDPDLFVGGGHYNDAVLFVNSAKELGFEPEGMLITVGPSNPKLVAELGTDITNINPSDALATAGIAIVPQLRSSFAQMTVYENLELGMYRRRDKARVRDRIDFVCALFPKLAARARQPAGTMSGGEQWMLEIGRSLMWEPRLVLVDEPSAGLSPIVTAEVFETVRRLNREIALTVLMIEQNARQGLETSHRGYAIEHGHITHRGDAADLLQDPKMRRVFLGAR